MPAWTELLGVPPFERLMFWLSMAYLGLFSTWAAVATWVERRRRR